MGTSDRACAAKGLSACAIGDFKDLPQRSRGIMAQDGSQPWKDTGAFSYLLHQPAVGTSTYAAVKAPEPHKAAKRSGNTGTWDGPAPLGALQKSESNDRGRRTAESPAVPSYVLLPGGEEMPLMGFGTDKIFNEEVFKFALDSGYRHFDCAANYKNEAVLGNVLGKFMGSGDRSQRRQELFITSKVWNDNHRPEALRQSTEKSIQDLQCEYLDLLLMHWPEAWLPGTQDKDEEASIESTWEAMEALVKEGKVKHLGVSNFGLSQIDRVLKVASIRPVVNQIELHPLLSQRKLVGGCRRKGLTCVAYSPLGHGKSPLLEDPAVLEIAKEVARTPAQVLLKWNLQRGVAVIPRSQTEKNIKDNIEGAFSWELSESSKEKLDRLDRSQRFVNQPWHSWEE